MCTLWTVTHAMHIEPSPAIEQCLVQGRISGIYLFQYFYTGTDEKYSVHMQGGGGKGGGVAFSSIAIASFHR